MYYRLRNVLLAAISTWAAAAEGQDLKTMQYLNMVVSAGSLRFRVVSGRVSLDAAHAGFIQYANTSEQISVLQSDGGDTTLSYNWTNGKKQLSIEASNVSKVHIRYGGKGDDPQIPVEFSQPLHGKTVLKVGPEGKQRIYSAPNLWHLFLAYPAETKQYLVPLLALLHPNWRLSESAAEVEVELLRKAHGNETLDRRHWAALVEQLGDESFARRQAADRAIRAADPAVLNYLQQLDFSRLDAEQQFRVRRIIEALSERLGDDTPEQTASWLSGDPSVWLILLNRSEAATRRQAVGQLTAMLGGPIPVDPEADPATQKTQLEQLRLRIEGLAAEDK
ncbi:MAG: hypothetical protein ABSA16_00715 [Thermoguttaceae bacterium]|jgi:hypothetical protein